MYEANPMALIVEEAGRWAATGSGAIVAVEPGSLHQRVPVIMGSHEEVDRLAGVFTRCRAPARPASAIV